jgi:hypothetical protein
MATDRMADVFKTILIQINSMAAAEVLVQDQPRPQHLVEAARDTPLESTPLSELQLFKEVVVIVQEHQAGVQVAVVELAVMEQLALLDQWAVPALVVATEVLAKQLRWATQEEHIL